MYYIRRLSSSFVRLTKSHNVPARVFGMDIGGMRHDYNSKSNLFLEDQLERKEPISLFQKWFEIIRNDSRTVEPNAVCLATCTKYGNPKEIELRELYITLNKDGIPSARFVLLKGFGKDGFRFFTHYTSRKGQELEENPKAALTFYWEHYSRSVRIEGDVEKLPIEDADEYFSKRPYESQIGALCSDQSKPVRNRDALALKEAHLRQIHPINEVPRPRQWGGYLLKPHTIEFWQGQTDRIHDRIRFRFPKDGEPDNDLTHQGEDGWIYERLCP
ncbi:hypothetical protein HUJ05_008156 [Dendroctonus ponderosae]|nr:hypothetical protein HUJ05_008156 [Dendroctonus ponderosae]